ncbi:bactofilin family protein [Polaromonas jejuensis]|uniref:Polymer-forming cytoskeletal protein n=1 Tax=Polaromonas jejuensis TaxID=457502 RepID=A0ABW0QFA6_9BURK|nr:polymer-forming cytoskeletal protein [Polaromonas jejuensis]
MFGKKKQPPIKSLIAPGSCIEGKLTFTDGLRIDGEVVGDIRADESSPSILVISESAIVTGLVQADHVIINGRVNGPVHATELLELQPKARIEGEVSYKALEMHQGAVISGQLRPILHQALAEIQPAAPQALEDKPVLKLAGKKHG